MRSIVPRLEKPRGRPGATTRPAARPSRPAPRWAIRSLRPSRLLVFATARHDLSQRRSPGFGASAGHPESLSRRWDVNATRIVGLGGPGRGRGGACRSRRRRPGHGAPRGRRKPNATRWPRRTGAGRARPRACSQPAASPTRSQARPPPPPRHPGGTGRVRQPHLYRPAGLGRVRRGQSDENKTSCARSKPARRARSNLVSGSSSSRPTSTEPPTRARSRS